jgi:hypothetical protein
MMKGLIKQKAITALINITINYREGHYGKWQDVFVE